MTLCLVIRGYDEDKKFKGKNGEGRVLCGGMRLHSGRGHHLHIPVYKRRSGHGGNRRMGFYFGKFIYLLDAYDDVEEDVKKGNYNPFSKDYIIKGFDDRVKSMLMMMKAETCREFEKLPIIKYTDILRNILYSGVWCRFETVSGKRKKEQEKEHV